ncbi:MAG: hypothetical protein MRECE_2c061 [Mycoplasmataceae bacterium CE_OT135]|nr:MAG: hypothetical protein MRECE_2c061 [Mycoplasmataceae bacterium CE_OT135]
MGTELLKLTNYTGFEKGENYLQDFQCSDCGLFINDKDIKQRNYQLWVSDYANDINKTYLRSGQSCHSLTFWLKAVDHKEGECPENERCEGCYEKFRINELKKSDGYFWCRFCQTATSEKEVSHE